MKDILEGNRMRHSFDEFKNFIKDKDVAVVGIGVSNTPLIRMLVKLGARVTACDKKEDIGNLGDKLKSLGVKLYLGENYMDGVLECNVIFRTPSLRPDNEYLKKARTNGAYITSEMLEFLKYCPAKIFGITGSDGKTTTTSLAAEMLKVNGNRVFLGGNIGTPLFDKIEEITSSDFVVVELSSFQLMDCNVSPDIAVITNLSPNHLDIHKDMDEYVNTKKNIFLYQDKDGVVILNRDNEITYSIRSEVKRNLRMFSVKNTDTFAYLQGEDLMIDGTRICAIDEVKLPGMHNIQNLLTAFCTVYGYASVDSMRKVATTFTGVEHRMEFVREINGVKIYNDAMGTSPTRTINNLRHFKKNVILIAGGYDKNIPFDELAREGFSSIKTLVLMGSTKDKIKKAFENEMNLRNENLPIVIADSLEDAVQKSLDTAKPGDVITLSPACAAFDMFKDYDEKGKKFKEIVMNI
jgi:UDP-N-acetylmuramoylalanine--D-glutamate ligase